MKRTTAVMAVLLMSLLLVSGAAAERPQDPLLFQLQGWMNLPVDLDDLMDALGPDAKIEDPSTWKHVKIRGFTAGGTVTFAFDESSPYSELPGGFTYTEDMNINPDQADNDDDINWEPFSTEQGDMILTVEGSDLYVQFVGRADLAITTLPVWPWIAVSATVIDQPWHITGGTGIFSRINGNGTRSTCPAAPPAFCVNYYGDIGF